MHYCNCIIGIFLVYDRNWLFEMLQIFFGFWRFIILLSLIFFFNFLRTWQLVTIHHTFLGSNIKIFHIESKLNRSYFIHTVFKFTFQQDIKAAEIYMEFDLTSYDIIEYVFSFSILFSDLIHFEDFNLDW